MTAVAPSGGDGNMPVLPDLWEATLADIRPLEDTVLAHSVRRILREADNPEGAISGFQACV